jgi:glycosyltransferase involved in cell wall biosynthesis
MVSVVIPAYNTEHYIRRAIESVLAQRYRQFECIVVDDGSTDLTGEIARSFGNEVRYLRQANRGASAARNAGLDAAAGRYIAFLDSDDYWLDTKLESQVSVMASNPELVLVSGHFRWLPRSADVQGTDFAGEELDPSRVKLLPGLESMVRDPYLCTPTVMVDASAARRIGGFDTTLPAAEDIDFFLRICSDRPYAVVQQLMAVCQFRPDSLTKTERGYHYNLMVLDRLEQAQPAFAAAHAELLRQSRLDLYRRSIRGSLFRGDGRTARHLLRESRLYGRVAEGRRLYLKSFSAPLLKQVRDRWSAAANPPPRVPAAGPE